jgi:hypothetical protein
VNSGLLTRDEEYLLRPVCQGLMSNVELAKKSEAWDIHCNCCSQDLGKLVYVVLEMLVKCVPLYAGRSMKKQAAKKKTSSGMANGHGERALAQHKEEMRRASTKRTRLADGRKEAEGKEPRKTDIPMLVEADSARNPTEGTVEVLDTLSCPSVHVGALRRSSRLKRKAGGLQAGGNELAYATQSKVRRGDVSRGKRAKKAGVLSQKERAGGLKKWAESSAAGRDGVAEDKGTRKRSSETSSEREGDDTSLRENGPEKGLGDSDGMGLERGFSGEVDAVADGTDGAQPVKPAEVEPDADQNVSNCTKGLPAEGPHDGDRLSHDGATTPKEPVDILHLEGAVKGSPEEKAGVPDALESTERPTQSSESRPVQEHNEALPSSIARLAAALEGFSYRGGAPRAAGRTPVRQAVSDGSSGGVRNRIALEQRRRLESSARFLRQTPSKSGGSQNTRVSGRVPSKGGGPQHTRSFQQTPSKSGASQNTSFPVASPSVSFEGGHFPQGSASSTMTGGGSRDQHGDSRGVKKPSKRRERSLLRVVTPGEKVRETALALVAEGKRVTAEGIRELIPKEAEKRGTEGSDAGKGGRPAGVVDPEWVPPVSPYGLIQVRHMPESEGFEGEFLISLQGWVLRG